MTARQKRKSVKPGPKSRRLETRSSGPTLVAPIGRRALLPHERDEAAMDEPPPMVRRNRRLIRRAARDVESGRVDTEARGTPSNVPAPKRRAPKRVKSGTA